MKDNCKINKMTLILSIFGLVLLLFFSPCKVRNFIQAELGVSKTTVSNKSQTTLNNTNCNSYEATIKTFVKKTSHPQQLAVIESNIDFAVSNFNVNFSPSYKVRNYSTTSIPLYILYQQFKDYL